MDCLICNLSLQRPLPHAAQCLNFRLKMACNPSKFHINILDGPRDGKIIFDTTIGRYYCRARGHPTPTYTWAWIQGGGEEEAVVSHDRFLDLRGIKTSGYYHFRCVAANIINGERRFAVMNTKLRVIGKASSYPQSSNL